LDQVKVKNKETQGGKGRGPGPGKQPCVGKRKTSFLLKGGKPNNVKGPTAVPKQAKKGGTPRPVGVGWGGGVVVEGRGQKREKGRTAPPGRQKNTQGGGGG